MYYLYKLDPAAKSVRSPVVYRLIDYTDFIFIDLYFVPIKFE